MVSSHFTSTFVIIGKKVTTLWGVITLKLRTFASAKLAVSSFLKSH